MAWQTQRKQRFGDQSVGVYAGSSVIPAGGGLTTTTVTLAQLGLTTKIEGLIDITLSSMSPNVTNISQPVFGLTGTSTAIGITFGGGTGTTLGWSLNAYGY